MIIERMTSQHTTRFINTSIKGAYIPGTTIRSMAEVIDTEAAETVTVNRMLDRLDWTCAANESRAASELKVLCQLLKGALHRCRQHQSELSDAIRTTQSCGNRSLDANFYRKAEKEFSNFEKQNLVYMSMNMELMLDDVEEILKLREVLNARQLMNDEDAAMDQVDLLVKQYDVFERGFEFQIQEIESLVRYLEQVSALKDRGCGQPTDRSADIELATCYHRSGEFWQAYREYLNCIELEPRCLSPCVELIQILMDCKLWRPAQRWLLKAESMFSASPEIGRLRQSFSEGLDAISEEIKKEWEQGNLWSTRKLLAEYMTLRPYDSQAIELKKTISKLDRQGAAGWKGERTETMASSAMSERLKHAVACVKDRELEKGIGILEGMYLDFRDNRAMIRVQIGDIRMMQKDYRSAIWNYRQARSIDPLNLALDNKIDRVKSIQEAG
jgi:tetratricopeptide (TPR) repeat protein